jgi:hypothetical protein
MLRPSFVLTTLVLGAGLAGAACSSSSDEDGGGYGDPSYADGDGDGSAEGSGNGSGGIEAGTLTAGAWDDNRNYQWFVDYLADPSTPVEGAPELSAAERLAAREAAGQDQPSKESLDVALLIDATGSMGDEIEYLKVELQAIAAAVATRYPEVPQRWATIAYRDIGDAYVTRSNDFTSDLAVVQNDLAGIVADGGGDTPEAVQAGLSETLELSWQSSARLVFWIADAPHHEQDAYSVTASLRGARALGLRIFPVASSGVDPLAELTMRSAAQLTGGRYLFLTDDSGVGNAHAEPSIPCYFVTHLDKAMVRMVSIELDGEYQQPEPADILRTGGDPESGSCSLDDGQALFAY